MKKEGLKQLSITLPEGLYKEIKHLSIDYKVSTKDFCITALKNYIKVLQEDNDDIEIECCSYDELTPEEKEIIDKGREERLKGEYIDVDTFLEETKEDED
jgi:hypothetical protein